MRAGGGDWYAYQNVALDSYDVGRIAFLKCGPGCTYEVAPEQYPDTPTVGLGWRYRKIGRVNFETGTVAP
jgi:hypothetical protein